MHQLVLLTALTATTGLFGGGRQRAQYYPAQSYYSAGGCSTCAGGYCYQTAPAAAAPAPAAAVQQAPVQQTAAAAAPQPAQTVQRIQYTYPQTYTYPTAGYYYTYAPASGCPGGNCYRR